MVINLVDYFIERSGYVLSLWLIVLITLVLVWRHPPPTPLPMDTFYPVSNKQLIADEENPIVHLSLLKLIHCFLSGTLFGGSKWADMAFTANGSNCSHSRAKLISFLFNYDYNIQNVLRHFPSIMSFVTCTSKHFHIKQTTNVPTKGHGSASFWYKVIYLIGKTKEF